mmetsp:Transcript_25090/g.60721  ORF Transcript_25090/g.60721 Transcript_25090/m.60721 type:complete len:314 (+) Transcript_25090:1-942(+)
MKEKLCFALLSLEIQGVAPSPPSIRTSTRDGRSNRHDVPSAQASCYQKTATSNKNLRRNSLDIWPVRHHEGQQQANHNPSNRQSACNPSQLRGGQRLQELVPRDWHRLMRQELDAHPGPNQHGSSISPHQGRRARAQESQAGGSRHKNRRSLQLGRLRPPQPLRRRPRMHARLQHPVQRQRQQQHAIRPQRLRRSGRRPRRAVQDEDTACRKGGPEPRRRPADGALEGEQRGQELEGRCVGGELAEGGVGDLLHGGEEEAEDEGADVGDQRKNAPILLRKEGQQQYLLPLLQHGLLKRHSGELPKDRKVLCIH